jgi:2-iminobutanoate/2-iminopropanoate deaminase
MMHLHRLPKRQRSFTRRSHSVAALGALLLAGCAESPSPEVSGTSGPQGSAVPEAIAIQGVETSRAPAAIGPYSQGILAGNALYLAGQIGMDPETGEMVVGGIEAETRQVMENLGAVLEAAGAGFEDVVQTQVFLADLADFATMNEIYGSYLSEPYPVRATVQVAALPRGARVEIQMVAVRGTR